MRMLKELFWKKKKETVKLFSKHSDATNAIQRQLN